MIMISQLGFLGNLGTTELMFIAVAALLLFGGKKLPELARGLGRGIREFKDASESIKKDISEQINNFEKDIDVKKMAEDVDSAQPATKAIGSNPASEQPTASETTTVQPPEPSNGLAGTYTHQPGREPDYYGSHGPYYHDPYALTPETQSLESSSEETPEDSTETTTPTRPA